MQILCLYHRIIYETLITEYEDDTQKEENMKIDKMDAKLNEKNILKEQRSHPPISQLVDGLSKWFEEVDKHDIFLESETYTRLIRDVKHLIGNFFLLWKYKYTYIAYSFFK